MRAPPHASPPAVYAGPASSDDRSSARADAAGDALEPSAWLRELALTLPRAASPPPLEHLMLVASSVDLMVCDGYRYDLYFVPESSMCWVSESGGIAGVQRWFGPTDEELPVDLPRLKRASSHGMR